MITEKMLSLYNHWIRADAIKYVLFTEKKIEKDTEHWPDSLREGVVLKSGMHRLEVYYALLYVVIEGYKEMKCQFESVDKLLTKNEYVAQLRRCRYPRASPWH